MAGPHQYIRTKFARLFEDEGFELPDPIPLKGNFSGNGWYVCYVLWRDNEGRDCLDYTADHRMTNPTHSRILIDGSQEHLEGIRTMYSFDPEIPGDKERAEKEYFEHNARVGKEMRRKGLI